MKTMAERLTDLRESRDWTKTAVAKKLGLSTVSTYANWEYGIRHPHPETIAELASLYEVSTDYLITGKDTNAAKEHSTKSDLSKEIKKLIKLLNTAEPETLLFNKQPLNQNQKEVLIHSLEIALLMAEKRK